MSNFTEYVGFQIKKETLDKIKECSEREKRSVSFIIRRCIDEYFERNKEN